MRFAYDLFDFPGIAIVIACVIVWLGFVGALILASISRARAEKRFGDPALVGKLATFDATARRATKGVLLAAAIALAFFALARPQFGRGTRLIPATNLDIAIVLDYSKSMYARDIAPSRITRAKAEVARLIEKLPGARFCAIAFAGEPMAFPLTSDGAAIAQFFRQLEPNDMPVGGTATAKALERARDMLNHDPKAKTHVKMIVLVTDGEDLEGDPVQVAKECAEDGIKIDVVQIGGRAPEVIPNVAEDGRVNGIRHDENGKPLMTELSAEGEAQLAQVASTTSGMIVRSENGETGIDKVAQALSQMMKDELSEKVETVYGEEYSWPLGAALVLFLVEAFIPEAPKKKGIAKGLPAVAPRKRRKKRLQSGGSRATA